MNFVFIIVGNLDLIEYNSLNDKGKSKDKINEHQDGDKDKDLHGHRNN